VPLEVVDEHEIALALGAVHLVDPEYVQGPPAAQLEAPSDSLADDRATVF